MSDPTFGRGQSFFCRGKSFLSHVSENARGQEERRKELQSRRSFAGATTLPYDPRKAQAPTETPPDGEQFYHTLPDRLGPQYFEKLDRKQRAACNDGDGGLFGAAGEATDVSQDLITAVSRLHSKGLVAPSGFVANERLQSLKDAPVKEMVQGDGFWKAWREACEAFVAKHMTTALNAKYMLGADKGRFVPIGNASCLDVLEGVLVHVWHSKQAAKEFIDGWRRVWAAVFECRLDGVTCPFSCMYRVQGEMVSVTALIPLEPSMEPLAVDVGDVWSMLPPGSKYDTDAPVLQAGLRRLCHALCIDAAPPLTRGLDGRLYVTSLDAVLGRRVTDAAVPEPGADDESEGREGGAPRARPELLIHMRQLLALYDPLQGCVAVLPEADEYNEEALRHQLTLPVLTDPSLFLRTVAFRRCALDLLRAVGRIDAEHPVAAADLFDMGVLATHCHRCGVNLAFLPMVAAAVDAAVASPTTGLCESDRVHFGALLCETIRIEMLARTLKAMAALDLQFGAGHGASLNDVALRVAVPNRIAQLVVLGDEGFLEQEVFPAVSRKFHGDTTQCRNPDLVWDNAGRLLRHMAAHLGCELDAEGTRFTHFCPIAGTDILAFRPPHLAQLYAEKHFAELDAEVPRMWARWAATPTGHPLRHTLYLQSAFSTLLCRATEKFAVAAERGQECIQDYDDHPVLQAEVQAMLAEIDAVRGAKGPAQRRYRATLLDLPHGGADSAAYGSKLLVAGLSQQDPAIIVEALQLLATLEGAAAPAYSGTFDFALGVAESLLLKQPAGLATAAATVEAFFSAMVACAAATRPTGARAYVATHLRATSMVMAAPDTSAVWASPHALHFARLSYQRHLQAAGARHRVTCMAAYHLAGIALRFHVALPAAAHLHRVLFKLLEKLRGVDRTKHVAAARSAVTRELMGRIVSLLEDVGDTESARLLQQHDDALTSGRNNGIAEFVPQGSFAEPSGPRGRLSTAASDVVDMDLTLSRNTSFHTPSFNNGRPPPSPAAPPSAPPTASPASAPADSLTTPPSLPTAPHRGTSSFRRSSVASITKHLAEAPPLPSDDIPQALAANSLVLGDL